MRPGLVDGAGFCSLELKKIVKNVNLQQENRHRSFFQNIGASKRANILKTTREIKTIQIILEIVFDFILNI